ncbi:peroxidase 30-like [Zingiber officinale]|uniref:Plant heme peroxidase family profile domain-containing protein n=1 Tax=Zingiber officinale TaxID=94328 RepID=A0A8J5KJV6_ZINOF|nr:peroxidase 30-like [Zingiber officinale]XP_042430415.1 peroxidase 30-like [Zingiber officinale]KAG6482402.1 hypothetical protein ZIOFF_059033 [Zingiber officinale]
MVATRWCFGRHGGDGGVEDGEAERELGEGLRRVRGGGDQGGEMACPETVSCADLLAIAARDSVLLSGGPTWPVQVGRRDRTVASWSLATTSLPSPTFGVATLLQKFENVGLSATDMVALSGAHMHHRQGPLLHVRLPPRRRRRSHLPSVPAASLFWIDVVEWDDDDSLVVGPPRCGLASEGLLLSNQALVGEAGEVGVLAN